MNEAQNESDMQQMFPCSSCGSQNAIGQRFCWTCGEKLQYNCSHCGAAVDPVSTSCPNCHTEINWGPQRPAEALPAGGEKGFQKQEKVEKKRKKSPWPVFSIALVVTAILVVGAVFAFDAFSRGAFSIAPAPGAPPPNEEPSPAPQPAPVPVELPVIVDFGINPTEIVAGQSATLLWNITGADEVAIDQGIGEVAPDGDMSVSPSKSTVYKCTATNAAGDITRFVTITVIENVDATKMVLTIDDVAPDGFVFETHSEPSAPNSISTHYIQFTKGNEKLSNSVFVHTAVSVAEKRYYDIKYNNRENIDDIVKIGDRGYLMSYTSNYSEGLTLYSIRFQKSNVYVNIGGISDYNQLETYAKMVESRIR